MITLPTKFEQHHQQAGGTQAVVVTFYNTNFTNFYYAASTRDMQIGVIHVHPHLLNMTGINEKVDVQTKKWATGDITITLLNPQYSPAGGGVRDRVSEGTEPAEGSSLTDWATVRIYLVSGEDATFTTDGILRFEGRIIGMPAVTEKTIVVKAQVIEREKHKILPTELVGTTYSSAPAENLEERIPICYGDYTQNYWGDIVFTDGAYTGVGLAKALIVQTIKKPKCVIADHVMNAITERGVFYDFGTGIPFMLNDSGVGTLDDSGHGTVLAGVSLSQTFHLNDTVPDEYTLYDKVAIDPENAHDDNTATDATIENNVSTYEGYAFWGINNEDSFRQTFWNVSSGDNIPQIRIRFYYAGWIGTYAEISGKTLEDESAVRLYYAGTADNISTQIGSEEFTLKGNLDETSYNNLVIGDRDDATFVETQPLALAFYILISPALSMSYSVLFLAEADIWVRLSLANQPLVVWIECKGREYGSWITASGRSIGSQTSGDLIENQAHIIESILRDELGIATANIDTASFDHAYDNATAEANRQARLNIVKGISSAKVIREIAEQSTFAFTWTAAGKARLIPLHSSYWSSKNVDSTIPWSHIKAGSLKISKTKIYCNELEAQSRWHGEANLYRDTDTTSDSGSQTSYGAWRRSAKWPSLAGSARTHVASRYVNSTDGLWSRPHLVMECETLGFTNAHLELGDCIKLDSTTVDPHLKAYAESWSGPKLCVIELQQTMTGTKIKAIELF